MYVQILYFRKIESIRFKSTRYISIPINRGNYPVNSPLKES